jgi:hypothetical protein
MINLSPINKKIRATLANRELAVSRQVRGIEDTAGTLDSRFEQVKERIEQEVMKTLWVKMFSAIKLKSDPENVERVARLYGGEVYDEQGSYHETAGYKGTYGIRNLQVGDSVAQYANDLNRPLPGILDFTCEYKGGLYAIREATINWVAWDMEDLERLKKHFCAHGKGVLLEWGYETASVLDVVSDSISEDEIIDGLAYEKINQQVAESGGKYDGIAGIISNFEWNLRDDGGFNVQTTIVSRGVNVLNKVIDQPDAPLIDVDTEESDTTENKKTVVTPTLPEFISAISEQVVKLSVGDKGFFGINKEADESRLPITEGSRNSWSKELKKQPPGVAYFRGDSFINLEKNRGPYVSWGWFEDNVLSNYVGRFTEDGKILNQFRSIQPILTPDGDFKTERGSTNDIAKAQMESVRISNSEYLVTPHFDRWILPGQFPFNKGEDASEGQFWNLSDAEMTARAATYVNNKSFYEPFAVSDNKNDGGYLRNILISTELLTESFKEAKTLKEGMQKLFDEISGDCDGFWNFVIVTDPYIPGNVKVIDSKKSAVEPSQYISEAFEKPGSESYNTNKEDNLMFVFDSWGDRSIVKSQTLSAKLPSAMAVTAMYGGVAKEGTETSEGNTDGVDLAKVTSGESDDATQKNVLVPNKLFGAFGAINPYDLENAGRTTSYPAQFGRGKGHKFELDWKQILKAYAENKDDETKKDKEKENTKKQASRKSQSVENFIKELKSQDKLYDKFGNLREDIDDDILFKRSMNNILSGTVRIEGDKAFELKLKNRGGTDLLPVELEIAVQGISGILPGNVFHVSYLPEIYKKSCVFQALEINQNVSGGTWETTIKGQIRVAADVVEKVIAEIQQQVQDDTISREEATANEVAASNQSSNSSQTTEPIIGQASPAFGPSEEKKNVVAYGDVGPKGGTRVTDFETAFRYARQEFGKGMVFTWLGNEYVTNYKEEATETSAVGEIINPQSQADLTQLNNASDFDSNNVDSGGDNNVSPYPNPAQTVNTDYPNTPTPGFSNQSETTPQGTTNTTVINTTIGGDSGFNPRFTFDVRSGNEDTGYTVDCQMIVDDEDGSYEKYFGVGSGRTLNIAKQRAKTNALQSYGGN